MPRCGASSRSKFRTPLKSFSAFLLWKQLRQIVGRTSALWHLTCGSCNEGHHGPIFYVPVILPYILKTIRCMNIILWDYESVWLDVWPQNKCRSLTYFMVLWFCLISWRLFDVWTSYFRIMSQYDLTFDLQINVGHCDLYFVVQWFCLISWSLFDLWTSYFGIMSQYDTTFDLRINVGHCNLYFMVQGFCLISWKLYCGCTSYYGIMSQYDTTFDLRINVGHCNLYFMIQWFCLISWKLFCGWSSYFGIISQYDTLYFVIMSPNNAAFALYFHGPVILPYTLNSIWRITTILCDNEL